MHHHYERGDTQRAHELHELALDLTEPPRTNGSHRPTHRVNGNPNGHSSQRQPSAERRGTAANKPLSQRILSVEPTWLLRALTDTIRWILSVEPPTASLAGGITTFKFTSLSVSALSTFVLKQTTPLSLNYCFTIESYCFTIESLLLAPYGWLCMFLASFSDVVVCSAPVIRQGQLRVGHFSFCPA